MLKDYSVKEFVEFLERTEEHYPISKQYDKEFGQRKKVWWEKSGKGQRTHMLSWFLAQETKGKGSYSRTKPNSSAKFTYNHLQCAGAVLWMAEALGECMDEIKEDEKKKNRALVKKAALETSEEQNIRKRAGIVRSIITWRHILELCKNISL